MSDLCRAILDRRKALEAARQGFIGQWQECGEVMLPTRADFHGSASVGDRRSQAIFDGTPMRARQGLATAIDALLKSKTTRWFSVKTHDEELNETDEVKRWLEDASERMWNAVYRREARFVQRSAEVDNDLVTFGTGALWIGENKGRTHLNFRSCHLRDILIAENSDGVIDTAIYTFHLNRRQAIQRYGEDALSAKIKQHEKAEDLHEFVHVVQPRADRDPERKDSLNLPFMSLVIEVEQAHKVGESGFEEFPYAVPRWDTGTGEIYGRSPAMMALPDALSLQAMGRTLLKAGEKAADPPLWAANDAVIGTVRTFPGGITVVDSEAVRETGGRPIGVLDMGKNIPIGREMQNDTRLMVEAAFFRNVFNLPVEGPQMTATEILQRKEEFLRTVGPIFGALEADYIGHVVERVFGLMCRAQPLGPGWLGQFPPPPDSLSGAGITFEFVSPVQQARKQIEAVGAMRGLEMIQPFLEFDPTVLDNFDFDEMVRDIPETFGAPMKWIRSPEKRDAMRQERAEAKKAEQALIAAQSIAATAKDGASAMKQLMPPQGAEQVAA